MHPSLLYISLRPCFHNRCRLAPFGISSCLDKNYHEKLASSEPTIKFTQFSESKEKTYEILTIGDSFSEQGKSGYQNGLAHDFSLLHIDRFISNNQIQTLIELCNGNFLIPIKFNM
ncbi:hypothetical protein EJ377_07055 [Chryseobacterium arthrosphaerae]|uniref:Uncharacterized protein n=1 Tax=Chryseobacterium arthrosphaerae TaxID=651561 RepID=A0A432DZW9_9FLAO|nr:hypothetical protein EJ377_07055 [Chryseobacterium arthrosphaerae]